LLTPDAIDTLLEYHWPGNVRELANVMEHAWILGGGGPITTEHLPHHLRQSSGAPATLSFPTAQASGSPVAQLAAMSAPKTLKEIEMDYILRVLAKHGGNKPAAAAELGIVVKTLYNKLNQWEEERQKNAG
jgi:DNA-binding NtrC family response regulator